MTITNKPKNTQQKPVKNKRIKKTKFGERVTFSFSCPIETADKLAKLAAKKGTSMAQVVIGLVMATKL